MASVSRSTSTPMWGAASASGSQLLHLMPHSYRSERDPRDPDGGGVNVGTFTTPSPQLADQFVQQFSGTTMRAQRVPAWQPRSTTVEVRSPDIGSIEAVVQRFGQSIDQRLRDGSVTPVFRLGGRYVINSNGISAEVPASILQDPNYLYFGEVRH